MISPCVKVIKSSGESVRKMLIELGAVDRTLKIKADERFLYIPVQNQELVPSTMEITTGDFKKMKKPRTLEEILGFAPAFDVIGDIAILDTEASRNAEEIARAILAVHKNVRTVLSAVTPVTGEFRVRKFRVIAGESRTNTTYKEHGCRYLVDLQRAYFNPRLSTERARIAEQIRHDETAIDMFAGVGSFSILIAKRAKQVIAIDINPDAIKFLRENVHLNSVTNVEAIQGDVRDVAACLKGRADRIIMNLPHSAHEYLNEALIMLKHGGTIHYYDIGHEDELFDGAIEAIRNAAALHRRNIEILNRKKVKSYAPRQYYICVDVRVS
ncbi:MAG: class I SAM-dependent methyltransferase family protein [Methanosarcinales archaeon Met12]|nr:MAG: class I SAM-dependent methyltransferase family protein [Methanosarcinales archaeon Met12]